MMTPLGWAFMGLFFAIIIVFTVYCFKVVLGEKSDWEGGETSAEEKPPPAGGKRDDT